MPSEDTQFKPGDPRLLGNNFGKNGGRPRTICPAREECAELGKDLVAWATEPSDRPRTTWCLWYALKHGMQEKHWKALCTYPEFRGFYEIARAAFIERIHAKEICEGFGHRYMGLYDRELYEYEDTEADKKEERKSRALLKEAQAIKYADAYQDKGGMDVKPNCS